MKKLIITVIIIMAAFTASAQNLWLGAEGQKFYEELLMRKAVKGEEAVYEGTPYMDDDFTESTIVSTGNDVFEKVPLRYNVYNDLFEVKMEEGIYDLKRGGVVSRVRMDNHNFIYTEYEYLGKDGKGYLDLIREGEYSLYKQHQVDFKEAKPAQPYQEAEPAMFNHRDPLFYISHEGDKPVFIRNRRAMLDYAGEHEDELKDFIKDKRIRMRDEEEFIKVVDFLNKLSS